MKGTKVTAVVIATMITTGVAFLPGLIVGLFFPKAIIQSLIWVSVPVLLFLLYDAVHKRLYRGYLRSLNFIAYFKYAFCKTEFSTPGNPDYTDDSITSKPWFYSTQMRDSHDKSITFVERK